jgi:hypothetical protein
MAAPPSCCLFDVVFGSGVDLFCFVLFCLPVRPCRVPKDGGRRKKHDRDDYRLGLLCVDASGCRHTERMMWDVSR